jgi:hypothetical protein
MFKCDCCGACCRNLHLSEIYKELDRGDGVCKYLVGNLCSIYENRPDICNVDKAYNLYFSKIMTKEEYYSQNYNTCKILKEKENIKEE